MALHINGMDAARVWDYENAYYWFAPPSRLDKALAHYEIYKRVTGLPGHVVELGVFKAASLVRLATFRRLLETDTSRRLVGFDAFGQFPHSPDESPQDSSFIARFEGESGDGLSLEDTHSILSLKGFKNVELIQGDILETLPSWIESNPEVKVALLHIDTDVYAPTKVALDLLWDRLVPGGILMLDDYNSVEGETKAVDELIERERLSIEKMPYYKIPSFIVKPL